MVMEDQMAVAGHANDGVSNDGGSIYVVTRKV